MTDFDEAKCLRTYPFEGDFGTPQDKVLSDKIVSARRRGRCGLCKQAIHAGERTRVLAAVFDGEFRAFRWCSACCAAMAASREDDFEAWIQRIQIAEEASE